jgi:hypothetical protein
VLGCEYQKSSIPAFGATCAKGNTETRTAIYHGVVFLKRKLPALLLALFICSIRLESAVAEEDSDVSPNAYWCLVADAAGKRAYHSSVRSGGSQGAGRHSKQIDKFVRAASGFSGTPFAASAGICHWFPNKRAAETSLDSTVLSYAERGFTVEVVAVY